jgi:aminopeptidase N
MKNFLPIVVVTLFLSLVPAVAGASRPLSVEKIVHHHLKVVLRPDGGRLSVEDTITIPDSFRHEFHFFLDPGLEPVSRTAGVSLSGGPEEEGPGSFRAEVPPGVKSFIISYDGSIFHPAEPEGREESRGFNESRGIISGEGVYLAGSSRWYPVSEDALVTFDMEIEMPLGWDAVSQGERTLHVRGKEAARVGWKSPEPQEEIFIVAAPFTVYEKLAGQVLYMVYLRSPEKGLAEKYLEAASSYIPMYEKLIGPYPYKKFALVENFWETGYGMPSFTLLGPRVIRLPFIITSSYPHEILHNWWGNSVYPDYDSGNWSEGLTAYLSDHLFKEAQGNGAEYRFSVLQKYADYVSGGLDFPLTRFQSRHSSSSEAVGYGMALMFFHMLRLELGDDVFTAGLRDFFRRKKFRLASFGDLKESFEAVSGKDLAAEFEQWVSRTGAPEIRMEDVREEKDGEGYFLTAVIRQAQSGRGYHLRIPVAVTMQGRKEAFQTVLDMEGKELGIRLKLPARPVRVDVDAEYDLFRRLGRGETPPAISQALGAKKMLVLLPSAAGEGLLAAYRALGDMLAHSGPDTVEILFDRDVKVLPSDRAVGVFGWENLFSKDIISALSQYGVSSGGQAIRIDSRDVPKEGHSFVLTARNPGNEDMAVMFVASDTAEALTGLGRKLPHYHKYSYLGFEGREPENMAKGRWPVPDSPLTAFLPAHGGEDSGVKRGRLSERKPLAIPPVPFSGEGMMETVRFLSSEGLQGRGFGSAGLDRAAEYIAEKFREAGLTPAGDKGTGYFQIWEESGGDPPRKVKLRNVLAVIPGSKEETRRESVVIGAHYDHLGRGWPDARAGEKGKIHPGADDNASGVAVLLELARVLGKTLTPERSIVFAAFAGEEAGRRGSRHYVAAEKFFPPDKCIGMLNLDTVGRLEDKKLLVLGGGSAAEWVHIWKGAGYVAGVDVGMANEELDSSDQESFIDAGVPAVQLFTGPHQDYHRPTDTPERIDRDGLVKVALVAREVIEYLSAREGPLTAWPGQPGKGVSAPSEERKVSLGTVPDFAFSGKGYRLAGVIPASPAERCGLREGDVITAIDHSMVGGIRDLSRILRALTPGSRIIITFLRDGRELTAETEVEER